MVCPSCDKDLPGEFPFCPFCGAALTGAPSPGRVERKTVTCLFCDLVGFTSRAEELDPEDVAGLLAPYQTRLKEELERFGGRVEKFIGDAVMALFGAPTVHEDDPERAVRAALSIRDFADEQGIELRIGIATGEALVSLGARPDQGETMATGDVVNTAARLQAAAPVNGILVGAKTYEATRREIEYRSTEAVEAKGKAQPVPAWEVKSARSRVQLDRLHGTRLVGRARELTLLVETLRHSREDRSPQLVTLIGVPGVGKSRLVYELSQVAEADPSLIFWRQGRCLPYGDGVTFWALGEIVKAQAGILESDGPAEAERKLREAAADSWVEEHLRPLVGLAVQEDFGGGHRAEGFAAWRQFFESLAEQGPLVLVVEDLHWADENLLDFVDYLVEWTTAVPLLVVCTARPELLERRPGWGGGKPNALTLSLSPLSDEETARLVAELLGHPLLETGTQEGLIARAGGNPLYAEQFARMLRERGEVEGLPLPETVQGIIAARLDGLSLHEKGLLQDGAVLGKVFWIGALSSLSALARADVDELLHALERKEFVRRERQSNVAGESEIAFRHMLVRDVAYSQIPRAERAHKHRLVAEWIESLGRPEDHAEMVAHHYISALDYAQAVGSSEMAEIAERARHALREAGDRALALDAFTVAERFYARAVELWPAEDRERPLLLLQYGRALQARNEGADVLAQASDGLLAIGDVDRAAEAQAVLGLLSVFAGMGEAAATHFGRAAQLAENRPASAAIVFVLGLLSRQSMLADENEKAIEIGRRALRMAEELGLERARAAVLATIGPARVSLGDLGGLDDLHSAIEIAEAARLEDARRAYMNLGDSLFKLGDLAGALELTGKAVEVGERFGYVPGIRFALANRADLLYALGRWDDALEGTEQLLAYVEAGSPSYQEAALRCIQGQVRLARGDSAQAVADCEAALVRAREVGDPQLLHSVLGVVAWIFLQVGRRGDAGSLAEELTAAGPQPREFATFGILLAELGRPGDVYAAADQAALHTPWVEAARAYADGDLVRAADLLAEIGDRSTEAYVRLRAAEQLLAARDSGAEEQLRGALDFYRSVGATRYIEEGETLLAGSA